MVMSMPSWYIEPGTLLWSRADETSACQMPHCTQRTMFGAFLEAKNDAPEIRACELHGDDEVRAEIARRRQMQAVKDVATFDVWASFQETPVVSGVDEATAGFLWRAIDMYEAAIGGEWMTWYTPAGKRQPRMLRPDQGEPPIFIPQELVAAEPAGIE